MPGPRAINNPAISYFWGSELSRAVTRHFWRMQRDLGFKAKHDGMRQIIATHFVNDLTNPLHITSLAVVSRVWNHVIIALLDSAGLHLCKFSARYENVSFYLSRLCKSYLVLKVSLTTFSTTFRPFFKKNRRRGKLLGWGDFVSTSVATSTINTITFCYAIQLPVVVGPGPVRFRTRRCIKAP